MRGATPQTVAALSVALGFWRRHPFRALTLVLGLALATALWTGVQAINAEARRAYTEAAETLAAGGVERLTARGGIEQATFKALRRAGWLVSPVIEGHARLGDVEVDLLGIDALTMPRGTVPTGEAETDPAPFLRGEVVLAAPETALRLDMPGVVEVRELAEGLVVVDIARAAALLETDRFTALLLHPDQPLSRPPLEEVASGLRRLAPQDALDTARLTDSFHLNLTAFGLLAFAVGLFIVNGAIGLAVEERRGTFRTLRALGVTRARLTAVFAAELLALALLGGALGVAAGWAIAGALLPGVAATLRGLYGAEVEGVLTLPLAWWAGGLLVAVLGTALAAATALARVAAMPILAAARPRAWARASARSRKMEIAGAGASLALGGLGWALAGGLVGAFALLGGVLLGAALLLPSVLDALLARLPVRGVLAEWFRADTRQQLPGLSLALMALLLALAANIGVGTMVGSFRATFLGWLDQRLAAELYIELEAAEDLPRLEAFLDGRAEAILPIWRAETRVAGRPAEVFGVVDHPTYSENWPLIAALPDAWPRLAKGGTAMINEQLARGEDIWPGDRLDLPGGGPVEVVGVYSDYGNPLAHVLVNLAEQAERFSDVARTRFALRVAADEASMLARALVDDFGLDPGAIVAQAELKAASLRVFERTFAVTDALSILTLAIAAFAILTSLLTLAAMRLPQLAPVWAAGLSRRQLGRLELARAVVLAILTFAMALPLGLVLAWILLALVNVEAFGWRLPMQVFPADWMRLLALTVLAAIAAGLWPAWRLGRMAPTRLLGVFAHER